MMEKEQPNPGNIMIVDDNPSNLKLLEAMLRQQGHEVHAFPRGRLALAEVDRNPPDLILLDINMPEMNGYEVCERLKATHEASVIPVIFLSALTETQDKVKAFQAGAVDYISKPFQFEEVHARVEAHLQLHYLQRALHQHNDRLEEVVAMRTRELAKANERLTILDRSKNDFLNLISHEFRTPLNGLLGVGDLVLAEFPCTPQNEELRSVFGRCRRRILSILDDALLLTQIDINGLGHKMAPVSLGEAFSSAITKAGEFAESREVALMPPPADFGSLVADEELLVRAFQALLEAAVKFSQKGEMVKISRGAHGSRCVFIDSHGRAVPEHAIEKLFDLFSIHEAITPGGDLGVGLPLANRILSLFGASVSAANLNSRGVRLAISFQ